jgi:hypothetical protein
MWAHRCSDHAHDLRGGCDREQRWAHDPRQHVIGAEPLRREQDLHHGVGPVAAGEEREPHDVVPVQVASTMLPRNAPPPSSCVTFRSPVPASSTSVGGHPSSPIATHDVFPPIPEKAAPGAGVDPRTPQRCTSTDRP